MNIRGIMAVSLAGRIMDNDQEEGYLETQTSEKDDRTEQGWSSWRLILQCGRSLRTVIIKYGAAN
jgi:hypothetical protein